MTYKIKKTEKQIAEMMVEGRTPEDIIRAVWGEVTGDEYRKRLKEVNGLMANQRFRQHFSSLIQGSAIPMYMKAVSKLVELIDNENPWVAMNAAREIANKFEQYVLPEENNNVVITLENAPLIGVPGTVE